MLEVLVRWHVSSSLVPRPRGRRLVWPGNETSLLRAWSGGGGGGGGGMQTGCVWNFRCIV